MALPELRADICVIGSGAGGSVVASYAARAGLKTLVLERGGWFTADHMSHHETSVVASMFKDGGLQTTDTFDFYIPQGQCVGGSTTLSNAVAFRVPEEVQERWIREFGFPATRAELEESYERVERSSSVQPCDERSFSPGTFKFLDGCKELGLEEDRYRPFDKGIKDCLGCGMCNNGCPYERKRTPLHTYIPDAVRHGAEVLTYAEAWKLKQQGSRITELLVRRIPPDGPPHYVRVVADKFVLAAGGIGSAAVLLRSRVGHNAGKWVSFNAGCAVTGEWDEVIDAHLGDDMCAYYMTRDYTVESTINPPGALSLFTPAYFEEHWNLVHRIRHLFQAGVLVPSDPVARVRYGLLSRLMKHELVRYKPTEDDLERTRKGLIMAAKILLAGGAKRVFLPFAITTTVETFAEVENKVRAGLTRHADLNTFGSTHVFGGAVLSEDPRRGTIGPDFRVHGTDNLYVADGSVFPTALAVNPWITISATADYFCVNSLKLKPVTLEDEPTPPRVQELLAESRGEHEQKQGRVEVTTSFG